MYENKPGRLLELIIGILVGAIGSVFLISVVYIVLNAPRELGIFITIIILSLFGGWFSLISYRLLLSKPRDNGGLFSTGTLKFWCIFFIVTSAIMSILGIIDKDYSLVLSGVVMITACISGFKLANRRATGV